jgi:uncharacterized protein YlxW (UPF0749 family)
VVTGGPGVHAIEDDTLANPYEIQAIGSSETLAGSLTRVGGVISQLAATHPRAVLTVIPADQLSIPATSRTLTPAHGAPRL